MRLRTKYVASLLSVSVAAIALAALVLHRHRSVPLPADALSKIEAQISLEKGGLTVHVRNGSTHTVRSIAIRVVEYRPTLKDPADKSAGHWNIASSWCSFDRTPLPDGYTKPFDRQFTFPLTAAPSSTADAHLTSNFAPGTDWWECRILSAAGHP
jgi:hypothetical protein